MPAMSARERGRAAFEREAWQEAFRELTAADRSAPLDPEDLDVLATAAYLIGNDAVFMDAAQRAHHGFLERGNSVRAARSAYWLGFATLHKPGQQAQANGWLSRARRLLDESGEDCAE